MKFIIYFYAIITCFILTIFVTVCIIIAFPISIIGDCVCLLTVILAKNFDSPDKSEGYGSWIIFCKEGFVYIKKIYYLIIDDYGKV